jgi:hypothetical protein
MNPRGRVLRLNRSVVLLSGRGRTAHTGTQAHTYDTHREAHAYVTHTQSLVLCLPAAQPLLLRVRRTAQGAKRTYRWPWARLWHSLSCSQSLGS